MYIRNTEKLSLPETQPYKPSVQAVYYNPQFCCFVSSILLELSIQLFRFNDLLQAQI